MYMKAGNQNKWKKRARPNLADRNVANAPDLVNWVALEFRRRFPALDSRIGLWEVLA